MLCFPLPNENELIYSLVARAGVVLGEISHKRVLDAVVGNRCYVATLDLPTNLGAIADNYPECLGLGAEYLMFKHTLLPLYAPFIESHVLSSVMKSMASAGKAKAHTATGVNASIVGNKKHILVCPECLTQQDIAGKMLYLNRVWQAPGVSCCVTHGELINTGIRVGVSNRHHFMMISKEYCQLRSEVTCTWQQKRVAEKVTELLTLDKRQYPTREQWGSFYHQLGRQFAPKQNMRVDHDEVKEKVFSYWGKPFLHHLQLGDSLTEFEWITRMFRRHKSSFSFLQHLIVLDAINESWSWETVIEDGSKMKALKRASVTDRQIVNNERRRQWIEAISQFGIKGAVKNGFAAERTWLYRHDREWYLATNEKFKLPMVRENRRVDWSERDALYTETLRSLLAGYDLVRHPNRITKKWLIGLLEKNSSIERNLANLPALSKLLSSVSESVSEHQMRRVRNVVIELQRKEVPITEWRILREARLSDVRVRPETSILISQEVTEKGVPESLRHCDVSTIAKSKRRFVGT